MRGPLEFEEEFEERWQDWGRKLSGLGGWTGWLIVAVILGIWLLSGFYTVGTSEVALVKRFGAFVRETGPGVHYRLPSPIESVVIVDQFGRSSIGVGVSRGLRGNSEESLMLTGDFNIIHVEATVDYNVSKDPKSFAFGIEIPKTIVREAAQAVIREQIALHEVDKLLASEERRRVGEQIKAELQALLDRYQTGIEVLNVFLQEVKPPTAEVAQAFEDVNSAQQDKKRIILEAERYANEQLPKAEGQKQKILNEAEAYKQSRILQAQGDVARYLAILEKYRLGETVTEARLYIETMEEILPNLNKIILTEGGGVLSLLSLEKLLQAGQGGESQ